METEDKNTIDNSIEVCNSIINYHRYRSRSLFTLLLVITIIFLFLVGLPLIQNYFGISRLSISRPLIENDFADFMVENDSLSYSQYEVLMNKAVDLQELINKRVEQDLALKKYVQAGQTDLSDYILYGVFILVFGVVASFYRFHLKEISKQEHYLIGFQRIRVAGSNSKTKYDDDVKVSLTRNAFEFEASKKEKIVNPVPGHPTSDLTTTLLNKILEKLEFKSKKEKGT